mmetsp:Transcript_19006/g.44271  ORF Transcript_19006/g.44271 Transcript_19006/m.44271 type:complete len:425 (-) Transcript_19006:522-1796(-)
MASRNHSTRSGRFQEEFDEGASPVIQRNTRPAPPPPPLETSSPSPTSLRDDDASPKTNATGNPSEGFGLGLPQSYSSLWNWTMGAPVVKKNASTPMPLCSSRDDDEDEEEQQRRAGRKKRQASPPPPPPREPIRSLSSSSSDAASSWKRYRFFLPTASMTSMFSNDSHHEEWDCEKCSYHNVDARNATCALCGMNRHDNDKTKQYHQYSPPSQVLKEEEDEDDGKDHHKGTSDQDEEPSGNLANNAQCPRGGERQYPGAYRVLGIRGGEQDDDDGNTFVTDHVDDNNNDEESASPVNATLVPDAEVDVAKPKEPQQPPSPITRVPMVQATAMTKKPWYRVRRVQVILAISLLVVILLAVIGAIFIFPNMKRVVNDNPNRQQQQQQQNYNHHDVFRDDNYHHRDNDDDDNDNPRCFVSSFQCIIS